MMGLVLFRAMLMIIFVNYLSDIYDGTSAVLRNVNEQNRTEFYSNSKSL